MGTSVGTSVFNHHGWRAAAALSVGWQSFCILALLARGPHCKRYTWIGYEGGFTLSKKKAQAAAAADVEKQGGGNGNEGDVGHELDEEKRTAEGKVESREKGKDVEEKEDLVHEARATRRTSADEKS